MHREYAPYLVKVDATHSESPSSCTMHSTSHANVSNGNHCHLCPYGNPTGGPSPSRSQPTLSTLATDCIMSSSIDVDCENNVTGPDISPTSIIGGYDMENQDFRRYVTQYPTSSPNCPPEHVPPVDPLSITSPMRPFQCAPASQPRLVKKPRYVRPSPNNAPTNDHYSLGSGLRATRPANKTPSQSMNELRLNDSPTEYNTRPSNVSGPRFPSMPSNRFPMQSTPKINILRKSTNTANASGMNSRTVATSPSTSINSSAMPRGTSTHRRAMNVPENTSNDVMPPVLQYSSTEDAVNSSSTSLIADVRVINTPTKDVTVYRRPALPSSSHAQNRSKQMDYGDGTNLTRIPPNLSKSIDSSQSLSLNLSVESSADRSGSENHTPSNLSTNERGSSRRSSDDVLGNTVRFNDEVQLEKMGKIQYECCVKNVLFKPSEYERSHMIGLNKEHTIVTLDRRYFAPYMSDGLPHVDFPLTNAQMKIITTRRTLRLRHPSFPMPFFVMFENDCVMRSWAAVISAYIITHTPSPGINPDQEAETKSSKNKTSSRNIFKIRVPNRKVTSTVPSNPLPAIRITSGQLIPLNDTEMRVINACLSKCVPSPQNPNIPLFLEMALEIVERFYCTTPGLYRLSPNRQVVDAAIQGLSKAPDQVKLDECEEVFSHPKDLTALIKTFTRSLTPRFFEETTMNSFLKYVSHPNLPLDSSSLSSSETSRPVDINAEGVKKCLLKLWRGQLDRGGEEKDSSNIPEMDKDASLLRQRLTYLCLKRLCLHICLMGNHACDKSHRLNVHGLASMFACNWHDSTDPLIITFMNKLIAVLSEQYEWFFDETLTPLSNTNGANQYGSLSGSNPLLDESVDEPRRADGDEANSSPRPPDQGSEEATKVSPVRPPNHNIAETIEASESVKAVVLEFVKQRLKEASGCSQDYNHLLTYSNNDIPRWSGPFINKESPTTKFHQEIDIDAAVSRQLAKNKDLLSIDSSQLGKDLLVDESDEEDLDSEREDDLPQLEFVSLKASALRNRRPVGGGGLVRDLMNAAQQNIGKPIHHDSLDSTAGDVKETSPMLNKSFSHPGSLVSP